MISLAKTAGRARLLSGMLCCLLSGGHLLGSHLPAFSANRQYMAQTDTEPFPGRVSVYRMQRGGNALLWQSEMRWPWTKALWVSHDGRHVVQEAEYLLGDEAVYFYDKRGVVKVLSLSDLFSDPSAPREDDSQEWPQGQLADPHKLRIWNERVHLGFLLENSWWYCLWLTKDKHWRVWDIRNGQRVRVTPEFELILNRLGFNQARAILAEARRTASRKEEKLYPVYASYTHTPDFRDAFNFLSWSGDRAARQLLTPFLHSTDFMNWYRPTEQTYKFRSSSYFRTLADQALSRVGNRSGRELYTSRFRHDNYRLASLDGILTLPFNPAFGDGPIFIFLVPANRTDAESAQDRNARIIDIDLNFLFLISGGVRYLPESFGFRFEDVTPGSYWLTALWDKAPPFMARPSAASSPGVDDFVTAERFAVQLTAGQNRRGLVLDIPAALPK